MSEIDYNTRDLQTSIMRLQEENEKLKEQSLIWMKRAEKLSIQSRKSEYELIYIKSRIWQIKQAIQNQGPKKTYHQKIVKKHRKEWPTLWVGIDKLIEHYDNNI